MNLDQVETAEADRFDGVVTGDPGFKLATMSSHEVYDAHEFGALATSMGLVSVNGVPLASNTFTDQDLQFVSKSVLDACDALDGLEDDMVNKPLLCTTATVLPQPAPMQWRQGRWLQLPGQHVDGAKQCIGLQGRRRRPVEHGPCADTTNLARSGGSRGLDQVDDQQ